MKYRGYRIRIGGPCEDGKVVQIWSGDELVDRVRNTAEAYRTIDQWHQAR